MKQFISGVLFGIAIGGSVIAAAQQFEVHPAYNYNDPSTFISSCSNETCTRFPASQLFIPSSGRVAQFNAEGDILPGEAHKVGDPLIINMTPTGEVVCTDFTLEKMVRAIAEHIGVK